MKSYREGLWWSEISNFVLCELTSITIKYMPKEEFDFCSDDIPKNKRIRKEDALEYGNCLEEQLWAKRNGHA